MKRAFLYLLFLLLIAGGAAAYFFDDWRELAGSFAKNVMKPSQETSKKIDKTTPSAAKEEPSATPAGPRQPAFDVVRVDPIGTAIFAGRAEPGWQVRVETKGQTLGKAEVDANGDWIIMVEKPIAKGNHEFVLVARAPDGKTTLKSTENVKVALDVEDKAQKKIQVAANASQPISQNSKPESKPAQTTGKPATKEAGKKQQAVEESASAVKQQTPKKQAAPEKPATVAKAEPEKEMAKEHVAEDTAQKSAQEEATMTASSRKKLAQSEPKTASPAPVVAKTAEQTVAKASGSTSMQKEETSSAVAEEKSSAAKPAKAATTMQQEPETRMVELAPEAAAPASDNTKKNNTGRIVISKGKRFIIVRRGDSLWAIAKKHYGKGYRYKKIFKQNRKKIRDPHWIYPEQRFKLPK